MTEIDSNSEGRNKLLTPFNRSERKSLYRLKSRISSSKVTEEDISMKKLAFTKFLMVHGIISDDNPSSQPISQKLEE